ncbi:hypothetical protein LZZ85_07505 [Terrimonas sp. NA20]|uniref:Uncharacterized protein n=1 Tax=Terrimonas ginsenosidimutans TaxID=2908004 RepID=A0ABS9KP68_9BACT|nr:hypothetical protein [Terrimonas ginsenosidimutans]MCG2614122.1 hypothetical protein [Terrimonas ginsenosidimutans]
MEKPFFIFYCKYKEKINGNGIIISVISIKKIANALETSFDHLVCEGLHNGVDKKRKRLQELEQLDEAKKKTLYDLLDTYIRDA